MTMNVLDYAAQSDQDADVEAINHTPACDFEPLIAELKGRK